MIGNEITNKQLELIAITDHQYVLVNTHRSANKSLWTLDEEPAIGNTYISADVIQLIQDYGYCMGSDLRYIRIVDLAPSTQGTWYTKINNILTVGDLWDILDESDIVWIDGMPCTINVGNSKIEIVGDKGYVICQIQQEHIINIRKVGNTYLFDEEGANGKWRVIPTTYTK